MAVSTLLSYQGSASVSTALPCCLQEAREGSGAVRTPLCLWWKPMDSSRNDTGLRGAGPCAVRERQTRPLSALGRARGRKVSIWARPGVCLGVGSNCPGDNVEGTARTVSGSYAVRVRGCHKGCVGRQTPLPWEGPCPRAGGSGRLAHLIVLGLAASRRNPFPSAVSSAP